MDLDEGDLSARSTIARTGVPWPHASSWAGYFPRPHHSGRQTNPRVTLHPVDACCVQGNILITREGQACLSDFGIAGAFKDLKYDDYKSETFRYMAPECLPEDLGLDSWINCLSTESDVYSLAMTSFEVRSSAVNDPITRYNRLITARSSQGYCHTTAEIGVT